MTEPAKTPRRYIVTRCEGGADTMHPAVDGDWCLYDDVAPLLQRIAELEQSERDYAKTCERKSERIEELTEHCASQEAWLDKPDKPGWWLKRAREDSKRVGYAATLVYADDFNDSMSIALFSHYDWRFISE